MKNWSTRAAGQAMPVRALSNLWTSLKPSSLGLMTWMLMLMLGISFQVQAQITITAGSGDLPITQVRLDDNGTPVTQNASQVGVANGATSNPLNIVEITVTDGGPVVLDEFNFASVDVRNINFPPNCAPTATLCNGGVLSGVSIWDNGVVTNVQDPTFEVDLEEALGDPDLMNFMRYDFLNINGSNWEPDFDFMFQAPLTNDDYLVVMERNGNTFFDLIPLDINGNAIPGAITVGFDAAYRWNIGYATTATPGQPMWFTVADINVFGVNTNTTPIYGFRIDNNGEADVKFFGLGPDPFVIPADYGDAPASYGVAEHNIEAGISIGSSVDSEASSQFSANADGDDTDGNNDDDGVTFTGGASGTPGSAKSITVELLNQVHVDDFLSAWVDFNGDGVFDEATEKIIDNHQVFNDPNPQFFNFNFNIPANAACGNTYARFRYESDHINSPTGSSDEGEVEDYLFTITCNSSLGDRVWEDLNGDGDQDAGEPGIDGVTVELFACSDKSTVLASTVTAGGGAYSFPNLTPGDYCVVFTTPAGYVFTQQDQGGDDALDSDADPSTGESQCVTLGANEDNTSVDAGMYRPASLGNFVWDDLNEDGDQDAGEPGLDGVTVELYQGCGSKATLLTSTVTAGGGAYSFTNLAPGDYCIVVTNLPAGYVFTGQDVGGDDTLDSDVDSSGEGHCITLSSNEDNDTVDAGAYEPAPAAASLGNFVWDDLDGDGIQDPGEPGLDGVTVELFACSDKNTVLASTVTAGGGAYSFPGLAPGDYCVVFSNLPAGYIFTGQDQGGDDSADSDVDSNGESHCITLAAGENNTSADAGAYAPASLGDMVWDDLNQDGIQDAGEPGVDGVTVELFACSDKSTVLASTVTAGGGMYNFAGLAPGDYCVVFSNLPAGYVFTTQDAGGDDAADSDANPANGESHCVTLTSGETEDSVDAGIYQTPKASLGNFVWDDLDGDGIQDPGEPGLDGVTVELFECSDKNTVVASTVTAAGGMYIFSNIDPGDYCVVFSNLPAGYGFSAQDQGGDDAADSDVDSSGESHCVTLAAGETNTSVDAGAFAPASLGDMVWDDLDGDGIQDPGEPGLDGVTVELFECSDKNTVLASTVTAGGGAYSFPGLAPGDYCVVFSNLPAGYIFTGQDQGGDDSADSDVDSNGESHCITLSSNEDNDTVDAGAYEPAPAAASLGNFVWDDLDGDGIQDPGEPGLDGVTVELFACSDKNTVLASTVTAGGGMYNFAGLTPGDYCIEVTLPVGYAFSPQNQGNDDTVDSDVDNTGTSDCITLAPGENNTDLDVGIFELKASLGNMVWEDLNGDGIQDPGEPGLDGVTVELFACSDKNTVIASTVTSGGGMYQFTGLDAGDYCVVFSNFPAGYTLSPQDQGGDDSADSDADATGQSPCITLAPGEFNDTVDAGLVPPAPSGDADLCVTKVVNDAMPMVGEQVTFTIFAINNGPNDASNVTVLDLLPNGLSYDSHAASKGSYDTNTGVWDIGTLANGESATLTITATVTESGSHQNCATIACPQDDPNPDNNHSCATVNTEGSSGGGGAGVESQASEEMAVLFARRLFSRTMAQDESIAKRDAIELPALEASTVNSHVDGAGHLASVISALVPEQLQAASATGLVSTPTDLLGYTNATAVFAADYVRSDSRRAAALFATSTPAGQLYDHTKLICDRFGGGIYEGFERVSVAGHSFILAKMIQPSGEVDYAIELAVYNTGSGFEVENRFSWGEYTPRGSGEVMNFQIWGAVPAYTIALAEEVLANLGQLGQVSYQAEAAELPSVFVRTARYDQGRMWLELVNRDGADQVRISGRLQATELGGLEQPFDQTISLDPSQETREVELVTGPVFSAILEVETSQRAARDRLYQADGAWSYASDANSQISGFSVQPQTGFVDGDLVYERRARLSGRVAEGGWVSLFRQVRPAGQSADWRSYRTLEFEARGSGEVILQIHESGQSDAYQTRIVLSPVMQRYAISFSELRRAGGVTGGFVGASVEAVAFYPVGSGVFDMEVEGLRLRYDSTVPVEPGEVPSAYLLDQNYPNPFNPETQIRFGLPESSEVKLSVYDVLGREVAILAEGRLSAGVHVVTFGATGLPSGTYIYRLETPTQTLTQKMTLLK